MARILLVDDDDDMVDICGRLLPRRGHELSVARDAAEAVEKAEAELPELILMDMRMPLSADGTVDDQAGLVATRRIRENSALDGTPVVALTGHMMNKFRESILEAGCVDLLPKPIVDFKALVAIIDRHLPES